MDGIESFNGAMNQYLMMKRILFIFDKLFIEATNFCSRVVSFFTQVNPTFFQVDSTFFQVDSHLIWLTFLCILPFNPLRQTVPGI